MQRKSRILNRRSGFAMIMAIFFMIVIATLLSYMLASSAGTSEKTTKVYLNEQAQLLAKSAVEYALLRASGFNRDPDGVPGSGDEGCLTNLFIQYPTAGATAIFDITVTISYHGLGIAGCTGNGTVNNIATAESVGTMLIDVYVKDNANLHLEEPVRYHRRTLQKL